MTKDSFADDFTCSLIKKGLTQTLREGKEVKAQALAKAKTGQKKKDEAIKKDANKLIWSMLGQQWCLLLIGAPFMFLGSFIDLMAPNYIGKILDDFLKEDFSDINWLVVQWVGSAVFSAICTFLREAIFGTVSQKLGRNMRQKLFESLINKDINFYDSNRTGAMLSRLGSDT